MESGMSVRARTRAHTIFQRQWQIDPENKMGSGTSRHARTDAHTSQDQMQFSFQRRRRCLVQALVLIPAHVPHEISSLLLLHTSKKLRRISLPAHFQFDSFRVKLLQYVSPPIPKLFFMNPCSFASHFHLGFILIFEPFFVLST
jgi:hypothetical protein